MAILHLFRKSRKAYFDDRSIIYVPGLAYCAIFAIPPLLVFVVTIAGYFIGRSQAVEQVVAQAQFLVGPNWPLC